MFNCFNQQEFLTNLIIHLNKLAKLTSKSEMMHNTDKELNLIANNN